MTKKKRKKKVAKKATRRRPLRKGDIVEIEFHDHVEDGDEAIHFIVWGRVEQVTRLSYKILSWAYADPDEGDKDSNKDNVKTFTIVKKATIKASRLIKARG